MQEKRCRVATRATMSAILSRNFQFLRLFCNFFSCRADRVAWSRMGTRAIFYRALATRQFFQKIASPVQAKIRRGFTRAMSSATCLYIPGCKTFFIEAWLLGSLIGLLLTAPRKRAKKPSVTMHFSRSYPSSSIRHKMVFKEQRDFETDIETK